MRLSYIPLSGLFLLLVLLTQAACVPPGEEEYAGVSDLNWQDTAFQRIAQLQDRQRSDSLYTYLRHPNPTYRYLAARAFGSFMDSSAVDSLARLLDDPFDQVRAAAAYALGQQGLERSADQLVAAFEQTDTGGVYRQANAEILAAVGKVGNADMLRNLAGITTYNKRDTALLAGQAWGIYYFALRQLTDSLGTRRMADIAGDATYPPQARLVASHYLQRAPVTVDSVALEPLIRAFEAETDPNVRMNLAIALGKGRTETALQGLLRRYARENDWRVKVNIIRALSNYPYERVRDRIVEALRDPNPHVARRAAEYFTEKGVPQDATLYWRFTQDSLPTPVQLELYRAANRHLPNYFVDYREAMNYQLRQRFGQYQNPYNRAHVLQALAEFPWNFRVIQQNGFNDPHHAVRTAAVNALGAIAARPDFDRFFRASARRTAKELSIYLQQAIQTGDPGMVSEAAIALRTPARNFGAVFDSLTFIPRALDSLDLPRDIEAYNDLQTTYNVLRGQPAGEPRQTEWNHPIAWAALKDLPAQPRARIRTPYGNIVLELWPQMAPGTVANFVRLAREGFYNGKTFHRVVANFVAQGGDPRGDGYGGADYSIRTETPPFHWDIPGIIGMASAGRHTESIQFFLTHSPTPHLDGRYTAFGRVVEGQNVVDQLKVGDVMEEVTVDGGR